MITQFLAVEKSSRGFLWFKTETVEKNEEGP